MNSRVNDEMRANIRTAFADGMPASQIAKRLRLHPRKVKEIIRDVPDPHAGETQKVFARLAQKRRWNSESSYAIFDRGRR